MTDIIIPSFGESITEVYVARWLVEVGETVTIDQPLVSLETDKAAQDLPSPVAGVLVEQCVAPDDAAGIGDVIARVDESATKAEEPAKAAEPAKAPEPAKAEEPAKAAEPAKAEEPAKLAEPAKAAPIVMPAAVRVLAQGGVTADDVTGTGPGGRVLKEDAQAAVSSSTPSKPSPPSVTKSAEKQPSSAPVNPASAEPGRVTNRVKMTRLRKMIAARLVGAQNEAAILTTFNEADMSAVMALRKAHQPAFVAKNGIKLGFMSFFVKACVDALKQLPAINAQIDGDHIVYHDYFDIGVAVGGGKGLVVPIIRNAENLGFAQIEQTINDYGKRAQAGTLLPDEMIGGTFSISNGGVYGSMMSTPILNPPQSGILGMHNIIRRPVAVGDAIELRPMMYLALSYDHRIVDGREAVTFLSRVKDCIEAPERMLLEI